MIPPTFEDIVAARKFIAPYLPKTPLVRVPKLSEELGCDYYAKLENLQPTGAFKVRGGINLVGTACVFPLSLWERSGEGAKPSGRADAAADVSTTRVSGWVKGSTHVGNQTTLITASTGNHGQSIAYAGRLFDTRV